MNPRRSLHERFGAWRTRPLRIAAGLLLPTLVFLATGSAAPILYQLVITPNPSTNPYFNSFGASGKLGAVAFGGGSRPVVLTLTFKGDTANVVNYFVAPPGLTPVYGSENLTGAGSVAVTDAATGAIIAQARFLPSAGVFVSVDNANTGIGFGSFAVADQSSPSFPGEPVYPYGLFPGDPLASGLDAYDLTSNFSVTGDSYNFGLSCVGFPPPSGGDCGDPKALATSAGNLYIDSACCFFSLPNSAFTAQVQPLTAFSAFAVKADFSGAPGNAFDINGGFTLGSGSNGINPLAEVVTLQVGTYSVAIPAGSFAQTSKGAYVYQGAIAGVALQVRIAPVSANSYTFQAEGSGANLTGTTSPVTVGLTMWDDAGTARVAAAFR